MPKTDFEPGYLEKLAQNHEKKAMANTTPAEMLLVYSGALLNWVGEYINDKSINWKLQKIALDSLTLSGTGPEWDSIIRNKAQLSPAKLRDLMKDESIHAVFAGATNSGLPILVRKDGDQIKILDGMNRVISGIRDGQAEIEAYVGERTGEAEPMIEAHVIYDFIRAYKQRRGDAEEFKAALRFLVSHYVNARKLLETRFSDEWIHDEEISFLITEVLTN